MVYTLRFFFSSKCSLFHNSNVFGSCIMHILYTECAKIKKNNSGAKRLISFGLKYLRNQVVLLRGKLTITFKFLHVACHRHITNLTLDESVKNFPCSSRSFCVCVYIPHSIQCSLHLTLTESTSVKPTTA